MTTPTPAPPTTYPPDAPWAVLGDGRAVLVGSRCPDCGCKVFPALESCPSCGAASVEPVELGPEGVLYSRTTVHVGRRPFPRTYTLGMVDLDDGVRVTAQVDGGHDLPLDARVECVVGPVSGDADATTTSYRFRAVTGAGEGDARVERAS